MIDFRRAELSDIDSIMPVIKEAQAFLGQQNIDQWQDGFPSREVIENDIKTQEGYVIESDRRTVAYFAFYAPPEPIYDAITEGRWVLDTQNFGAMHRVAVSAACRGMGLGHKIYDFCEAHAREQGYDSLRVDTHPDNKLMQHLAASHGFEYCGVVYYDGGLERVAYEKVLKND